MELVTVTPTQVQVVTPDAYRFHAADYPVVYRKFVEYYKLHPDTTQISFSSRDSVLLQIIAIQHLLEPDIVIQLKDTIQIDAFDHDCDTLSLIGGIEKVGFRQSVVDVNGADGYSYCLKRHMFIGSGNAYSVRRPVLNDNGETTYRIHEIEHKFDRCTFDLYQEIYRGWLVDNPELKVVLYDCESNPYTVVHLCAVVALGGVNLLCDISAKAFQLIENARLKTLHLELKQTSHEPPLPLQTEWFTPECDIQNLILSRYGKMEPVGILGSFLQHSPSRKCVRLNLSQFDAAPLLFEILFREENTNLHTIVIKLENMFRFTASQLDAATDFMNLLSDMYINGVDPSNVCTLIWRDHGSFLGAKHIHDVVKRLPDDRFEGMVDYMWDVYKSFYHRLPLGEDGTFMGYLAPDSDESRITRWDMYLPLSDRDHRELPIIQKKERFRAIVKQHTGNDVSLMFIFKYLHKYSNVIKVQASAIQKGDYHPLKYELLHFFLSRVRYVPLPDECISVNLTRFYQAKIKHHALWRIASTGRRELLEPFTRGYGDLLVDRIAPLLDS
jgi:hypothetical protein